MRCLQLVRSFKQQQQHRGIDDHVWYGPSGPLNDKFMIPKGHGDTAVLFALGVDEQTVVLQTFDIPRGSMTKDSYHLFL